MADAEEDEPKPTIKLELDSFTVFDNAENGDHSDAMDGAEDQIAATDDMEEQAVDDPDKPKVTRSEEIRQLRLICKPYLAIIENKQHDINSIRLKSYTWAQITKVYNSCASRRSKTVGQLRKRWDNMKMKLRRTCATTEVRDHRWLETAEPEVLPSNVVKDRAEDTAFFNDVLRAGADERITTFDDNSSVDLGYDSVLSSTESAPGWGEGSENVTTDIAVPGCSKTHTPDSSNPEERRKKKRPNIKDLATSATKNPMEGNGDFRRTQRSSDQHSIKLRMLEIAEEQNERAKVAAKMAADAEERARIIHALEVEKRQLELELLRGQIAAQKNSN